MGNDQEPFSGRRRERREDGADPDWERASTYVFVARDLNWGLGDVRRRLTYGQLHYYLAAAEERLVAEQRNRFETAVEAARVGYITARDQKAYGKWQRSLAKGHGRPVGLTGHALEQAVMGFALANPDLVQFKAA